VNTRRPSPVLAIRTFGAVTNLGNNALQSAASWIVQARRQHRVKLEGFADPFTLADRPDLTEGLEGPERLFTLLKSAVAEALADQPCPDASAASLNILVLPEGLAETDQKQLAERLAGLWPDRDVRFSTLTGNATAAWAALDSIYEVLDANPKMQQVVMVCVDSLCEPGRLYQAAEAQRLLQKGNSEGYIPGEAAVCLVMERLRDVTELPAGGFALHRPALVEQADPWWPSANQPDSQPLVTALTEALDLAGMNPSNISHLLSDMDGSSWRAQIEADALSRAIYSETSRLPHWQPVNLLGQIGVATGPLGWILAAIMYTHRIHPLNTLLNWSIDPAGKSAACVMERSAKKVIDKESKHVN
jgi:3-oxoacyl-[acyl-carrier-protein] synthase-1